MSRVWKIVEVRGSGEEFNVGHPGVIPDAETGPMNAIQLLGYSIIRVLTALEAADVVEIILWMSFFILLLVLFTRCNCFR